MAQLPGFHCNWLEFTLWKREFCKQAGFSGHFTNHSGKVTCASQLFAENIDEQLIKLQTGHRSDSVRDYKRPANTHALHVSNILQPSVPKKSKLVQNTTAAVADPGADKENMIVPTQSIQNSNQSSVMHSNVMHFTNVAGSSPTFVFNFGK